MKNRIVLALFALLVSSSGLWAQDLDQGFFKSIALVYTISTDKDRGHSQSMGLTANLFIFPRENLGYYISPGIGLKMKHSAKDLESLDMYFGSVFGPAFRIYNGGEVDVLAGIGPDISCMVHLREVEDDKFKSTETFLGIGLGGSLEARLKLYKSIAFTGGMLMKYNFAPYSEDRTFIAAPYIGIGF
jgi:hypothetical protein